MCSCRIGTQETGCLQGLLHRDILLIDYMSTSSSPPTCEEDSRKTLSNKKTT